MLAYLGNIDGSFIIMGLILGLLPIILGIWLVIEIIRYLRRH